MRSGERVRRVARGVGERAWTPGRGARVPRGLSLGLGLAAALAAAPLAGQAPERGAFVLLRGNDTLAVERFERSAALLDGALVVRVQDARIAYHVELEPQGLVRSIAVRVTRASAPDTATPLQESSAVFHGDSVTLRVTGTPARTVPAVGAVPYINLSGALLEQILLRARLARLGSVPVLLPNGTVGDMTVTTVRPDSVVLTVSGVDFHLRLDPAGRVLSVAVPAQGIRWLRVGDVSLSGPAAPDYAAPPNAPYTAEEVVVPGPAGKLAGTLTLPRQRGRVPAVVTITGSGQQTRDEPIPIGPPGYGLFRQVADTLSRRGIAVLRLDDRGVGGSEGAASLATATSQDFARDIEAAVHWLRARPEIDPARIGLVGHSEGGIIAPLVAAADPRIRAIVLMAGSAYPGRRISEQQNRYLLGRDSSLTGARLDSAVRANMQKADSIAARSAWLSFFYRYDPLVTARKVRTPVLILQGATDRQVSSEQAAILAGAFRAGGDRDVTVRVFPDRDHLFLRDPSGNPLGYAKLPSSTVDGEVLGTLADWLVAHLAAARLAPTAAAGGATP